MEVLLELDDAPSVAQKKRARALAYYLEREVVAKLIKGTEVLELGPNLGSVKYFLNRRFFGYARYTALDIRSVDHHKYVKKPNLVLIADATKHSFPEDHFDLVLCNHVLSSISDDITAMKNLYKTLKPGGTAILNEGLEENLKISITQQRMKELHPELGPDFYEENGVAWFYGEDYPDRLSAAGFKVEKCQPFMNEEEEFLISNGLTRDFTLFIGRK